MSKFSVDKLPDIVDMLSVLHVLKDEPGVFFLDSSDGRGWSYLGARPAWTASGDSLEQWHKFKRDAQRFITASPEAIVPFSGGIVGALSYDFGLHLEGVSSRHVPEGACPLFSFGYYDSVLALNHSTGEAYLCGQEGSLTLRMMRDATVRARRETPCAEVFQPSGLLSDHDEKTYVQMVEQVLALIALGEVYETNISRQFACSWNDSVRADVLYHRLRTQLPVPYGAFYDAGDFKLLSASPELFLQLKQGKALTRPMKGTSVRGHDSVEDQALRRQLEESVKERAELLMVTDLLRNDFGKVCRPGTVNVCSLREIEEFRNVFQATATIEGILDEKKDAFDLIEACFPGGSVTGCPKHRAVQAIDRLEHSGRGYYTGALGYISSSGNMMLNVLIRSIVLSRGKASFSVGGGIVADSDPVKEYEETVIKAQGLLKAFA